MGFLLLKLYPFMSVLLVLAGLIHVESQLSENYYATSCPPVENIVAGVLRANLFRDPTAPAALVRLAFHDCQVSGCDASILLDSGPGVTSELESSSNLGIRRLDFIDRIKGSLEAACPGVVSCADVIAMAARDAIVLSGGPNIPIPLGRQDGFSASASEATQDLPPATISVSNMLSLFGRMGMSLEESVSILGSHTLGVAHCTNFVNRLYPFKDPNLGFVFANTLRARCPARFPSNAFAALDTSNLRFDNAYFRNILNGRGLLTIDSELGLDPRTGPVVAGFASNANAFFDAFSSAFRKMTSFQVLTGNRGEVRQNCHFVN